MSDDQKLNPNPGPGIAHAFDCTFEKVHCPCYADTIVQLRRDLNEVRRVADERERELAQWRAVAGRLAVGADYHAHEGPGCDVCPRNLAAYRALAGGAPSDTTGVE